MSLSLRPFQSLAIDAALASFREARAPSDNKEIMPMRRQMIVIPTGCGKTITGLALARRLNARTLWLAHTEELVEQPERAAREVWPEVTRGIVKAERNEFMRHVVFASMQSAIQP